MSELMWDKLITNPEIQRPWHEEPNRDGLNLFLHVLLTTWPRGPYGAWEVGGPGEDSFLTVAYLEESSFFFRICEGCTINYNRYEAEHVSRPPTTAPVPHAVRSDTG